MKRRMTNDSYLFWKRVSLRRENDSAIDAVQLPALGAVERKSVMNENRHRKILHAEPPLNPLHRVEVIFARVFLVFRPSSRIGVQGSRSPSPSSALACFFSPFPFTLTIAAVNPCSLSLSFSFSSSVCQFIFVSLFPPCRTPPRPVSRPRSHAASEQRGRARSVASARICLAARARENLETKNRSTISNSFPVRS